MIKVKIYADFHNADKYGRLRLNCKGTADTLKKYKIELQEGVSLVFCDDDEFETDGVVTYSQEEKIWVAKIDWNYLKAIQ